MAPYGVLIDDLYLPAKRTPGTHYHGLGAMLMFGMLASFAIMLAASVWGKYERVRKIATALGILFMMAGFYSDMAA